jgi:hypothetical protein
MLFIYEKTLTFFNPMSADFTGESLQQFIAHIPTVGHIEGCHIHMVTYCRL